MAEGSKNHDLLTYWKVTENDEYAKKWVEDIEIRQYIWKSWVTSHSTSLLGGNLVDGVPPARQHRSCWGTPWGGGGSTYRFWTHGNRKLQENVNWHRPKVPLEFWNVLLGCSWVWISHEIIREMMIYSRLQIFMRGSGNYDFGSFSEDNEKWF